MEFGSTDLRSAGVQLGADRAASSLFNGCEYRASTRQWHRAHWAMKSQVPAAYLSDFKLIIDRRLKKSVSRPRTRGSFPGRSSL